MSSKVLGVLSDVCATLPSADVTKISEDEVSQLLKQSRLAQRSIEGFVTALGVRSSDLFEQGKGSSADEALRAGGAVGSGQARREARRSATVRQAPGLGESLLAGRTSGEHVDALGKHTKNLEPALLKKVDFPKLVKQAEQLPVEKFQRFVKDHIDSDVIEDHGLKDTKEKQAASELKYWFDKAQGMGYITGILDPERYEMFANTIDGKVKQLANAEDKPVIKDANLAAQALMELIGAAPADYAARNRVPSITVLVDQETLTDGPHADSVRETENGNSMPPESVARMFCDATIRKIVVDESGLPLNVGRKYRTATDTQWAALKTVYSSCGWNGCDAPLNWCQAHHITEWENGGRTDMANLIPLCNTHHHQVHEGQWSIKLAPDRTLTTYKPDKTKHSTSPPNTRTQQNQTSR